MELNNETEVIETLAQQIMTSARTAPKARGKDSLNTGIIDSLEKQKILKQMETLYNETGKHLFKRDAGNLEASDACILFGIEDEPAGLNCGGCGFTCDELKNMEKKEDTDYSGPCCSFKIMDLGIALGSACKKASELDIDNRLMYSVGAAAKKAGILDNDIVVALPLSIKGKNIFFDREKKK